MMKPRFIVLMLLVTTGLSAQNSKLDEIYRHIPPIPDKLMCDCADNYLKTISLLDSLAEQLREIKMTLTDEVNHQHRQQTEATSPLFPTEEELKKVEILSEEEQIAFWQKFEARFEKQQETVAANTQKYQAEKEILLQKSADYDKEISARLDEITLTVYQASEVKSKNRQEVYNNYLANNSLTETGKKRLKEISIEFCSAVSPTLLKKLRFEHANLKPRIALLRRLTLIDQLSLSSTPEEKGSQPYEALLDLTELEILAGFLTSYTSIFDYLPGGFDNKLD